MRSLTARPAASSASWSGFRLALRTRSACAWAAASLVGDVVTSEYKVNLLAPAIGDKLICRSEVIKAGQRQAVSRADVFAVRDGQERIIATGLATIARV